MSDVNLKTDIEEPTTPLVDGDDTTSNETANFKIQVSSPKGSTTTPENIDNENNNTHQKSETVKEITTKKLKSLSVTEVELENVNNNDNDNKIDDNNNEQQTNTLDIPNDHGSNGEITKKKTGTAALRLEKQYRIDDHKYKLFRGYIRQDWSQINDDAYELEELRAEWVELFFDLMFVAIIVHISSQAAYAWDKGSKFYLLTVFAQFAMLVILWQEQVMYESRFVMNQAWDDILRVLFMGSILALGLSVGDEEIYHKAFLLIYCLCKLFIGLMYIKVYLIPRSKKHAIYMIIEKIITSIICIILLFTVDVTCQYQENCTLWKKEARRLAGAPSTSSDFNKIFHNAMSLKYFAAYTTIFVFSSFWVVDLSFFKCLGQVSLPVNVPHIAERFGLFVLLILGESIISLMTAALRIKDSSQMFLDYSMLLGAFVIVYVVGRLYFAAQPSEEQILEGNNHAMLSGTKEYWRAKLFALSHVVLYLALLAFGIGTKITANNLGDDKRRRVYVMLPGWSLATITICMNAIRLAHPWDDDKKAPWYIWLVRLILTFFMIVTAFFWADIANSWIFVIYIIVILLQLSTDFEGKQMEKHKKHEMKLKAQQHANPDQMIEHRKRHFKKAKTLTSGLL